MDGSPPSWLAWFAVALPVAVLGNLMCWGLILLVYRPGAKIKEVWLLFFWWGGLFLVGGLLCDACCAVLCAVLVPHPWQHGAQHSAQHSTSQQHSKGARAAYVCWASTSTGSRFPRSPNTPLKHTHTNAKNNKTRHRCAPSSRARTL
jgi:hypothetical protein